MGVKFTGKAQRSLNKALDIAKSLGHTYVGTEHLLYAIVAEGDSVAAGVLSSNGLSANVIRELIVGTAGQGEKSDINARDMTPGLKKAIESAVRLSGKSRNGYIGTEHLMFSVLSEPDCFASKIIGAAGKNINTIKSELSTFVIADGIKSRSPGEKNELKPYPMLMRYGKDLVSIVNDSICDPLIGREREIERVMQILSRRTKNNPCLIGEPGVGKTAIVEGLAALIRKEKIPDILKTKRIVALDVASMIAGAKYRGEFEERMKGVMDEVSKNRNIILFIDELHTIVGAGAAEGAVDAANIIKPSLSRGEMQIIGATTVDEYRKHIEKDAALERRFQPVTVDEPSPEEAKRILRGICGAYEAHHGLVITEGAINSAVELSVRYIKDRRLPDKAIDLIDEASSRVRMKGTEFSEKLTNIEGKIEEASVGKKEAILQKNYEAAAGIRDVERALLEEYREISELPKKDNCIKCPGVTENDIACVVSQWTGIPVSKNSDGDGLSKLEETLLENIIGQDEAVDIVSKAVKRGRAGLCDPDKPIASMLFLGSSGVGKTELTRQLAKVLFNDASKALRFDMSEYSEKHSASKLIGSPPGYVGYEEGGELTEAVRRNPYCIVVFDEMEKAHRDVLNLLLQIMDEGRLTDSSGRETDFRNTVIIMTSNIGAEKLVSTSHTGFSDGGGISDSEAEREVKKALKGYFTPEFLNRIDETVVFKKLTAESAEKIALKLLRSLSDRMKNTQYGVTFGKGTARNLVLNYFEKDSGGRSVKRAVVSYIENALADAVLSGKYPPGSNLVCGMDTKGRVSVMCKNG